MIPSIETIVEGLLSGQYRMEQAIGWLNRHLEMAREAEDDFRDHCAALAMQALLDRPGGTVEDYAEHAYKQADAMLKERAK